VATVEVVTWNVHCVCDGATNAVPSTVAMPLLLCVCKVRPVDGALLLRVTVAVAKAPPATEVGFRDRPTMEGGLTCRDAVANENPRTL